MSARRRLFPGRLRPPPAPAAAPRLKRGSAFTLIELLVVTGILAVMLGTIVACIGGGIRVWDAAHRFDTTESDALLALRRLEKDVRGSFVFFDIPFEGRRDALAIPGLVVPDTDGEAPPGVRHIGRVRHAYDADDRRWLRWTSAHAFEGEREASLLDDVRGLQFEYYRPSRDGAPGGWQGAWADTTNVPERVRVEVELSGRDGPVVLERTIVLPVREPRKESP